MKTIIVEEKQTVYDLAAQHYGNAEAVGEILLLNPEISNEEEQPEGFYLDQPVKVGSRLTIDNESDLINKNLLKEINESVNTFEIWLDQ